MSASIGRFARLCVTAIALMTTSAMAQTRAAPGGTPASRDKARLLGPMASVLERRVGTWQVDAYLQPTPTATPFVIHAVAENHLIGGRWLVSELKSAAGTGGFEGLGVNGWDATMRAYSGYWIDGSQGYTVPVTGQFDEASGVFRTSSTERRADGETITVVSETRPIGADAEETTFTAPDANGRPYVRMRLRYTRAPAGGD